MTDFRAPFHFSAAEWAELERRFDGPIPQRAIDDYKAALRRRKELWEWHEASEEPTTETRRVYHEPAGVWEDIDA